MTHELAATLGELAVNFAKTLVSTCRILSMRSSVWWSLPKACTSASCSPPCSPTPRPPRTPSPRSCAQQRSDSYQDNIKQHLQKWEPVIAATVAVAAGNAEATELGPVLDHFAQQEDWAALVAVLRRILDGERGDGLLDGLDPIDTAIASQILACVTQPPTAPRQEGP